MSAENPTVFVVDDDVSMRDALKNLLRSVGLNVETFGSAQKFFSSQRIKDAGCLVLDIGGVNHSGLRRRRADYQPVRAYLEPCS